MILCVVCKLFYHCRASGGSVVYFGRWNPQDGHLILKPLLVGISGKDIHRHSFIEYISHILYWLSGTFLYLLCVAFYVKSTKFMFRGS